MQRMTQLRELPMRFSDTLSENHFGIGFNRESNRMGQATTSSVTWRPLGLDDISNIAEWFWHFEDIAMFDKSLPVPVNIDAMRVSWRASLEYSSPPRAYWFIAEDADKKPAGIAGLESVNYIHGDAVLPVFIADDYRKKGLATVMAVALLDLAFNQLRLHRLTTFYREDNEATRRALLSVGFKEEGRHREGWFADGIRKDIVIVGILGSEWAAGRDAVIEALKHTSEVSINLSNWKSCRD